jgi:hypothetical protein
MHEELTLTQVLAEEKSVKVQIINLVKSSDFRFVTWCLKNSQYVGPRSLEEQTNHQKELFQQFTDLMARLSALKKAHTHANHNTLVTVPCEPNFRDLINGKEVGEEEITIAEAINRKNNYKGRANKPGYDNTDYPLKSLATALLSTLTSDLKERAEYENRAKREVADQMERKFPSDSKQSWSQDKYNEERAKEEALVEIIRIDPHDFVNNNAIQKYYNAINDYIVRIDSIISEANASTKVEIDY